MYTFPGLCCTYYFYTPTYQLVCVVVTALWCWWLIHSRHRRKANSRTVLAIRFHSRDRRKANSRTLIGYFSVLSIRFHSHKKEKQTRVLWLVRFVTFKSGDERKQTLFALSFTRQGHKFDCCSIFLSFAVQSFCPHCTSCLLFKNWNVFWLCLASTRSPVRIQKSTRRLCRRPWI